MADDRQLPEVISPAHSGAFQPSRFQPSNASANQLAAQSQPNDLLSQESTGSAELRQSPNSWPALPQPSATSEPYVKSPNDAGQDLNTPTVDNSEITLPSIVPGGRFEPGRQSSQVDSKLGQPRVLEPTLPPPTGFVPGSSRIFDEPQTQRTETDPQPANSAEASRIPSIVENRPNDSIELTEGTEEVSPETEDRGEESKPTYLCDKDSSYWSIAEETYGSGRFFRALFAYNQAWLGDQFELAEGAMVRTPPLDLLIEKQSQWIPSDLLESIRESDSDR